MSSFAFRDDDSPAARGRAIIQGMLDRDAATKQTSAPPEPKIARVNSRGLTSKDPVKRGRALIHNMEVRDRRG